MKPINETLSGLVDTVFATVVDALNDVNKVIRFHYVILIVRPDRSVGVASTLTPTSTKSLLKQMSEISEGEFAVAREQAKERDAKANAH